MPVINFKIMGVFGERGERQILIDNELPIKQIKDQVRKEFKLVPNAKITFLHNGKKYGEAEDHFAFKRIAIDPRKENITIIVSNPVSY